MTCDAWWWWWCCPYARPANQCTSTPLPSPQMVMHFGNAEIIKLSSDQCQFSYNIRCYAFDRSFVRSFIRLCVRARCGVYMRPQSAHINKCLLFITWNLAVNAFCFGFFSLLVVPYAPSRFLFVCTLNALEFHRGLEFQNYWHVSIRRAHTNTCGSISRYGIKCIVCSKCILCVHAALNEAINLFCCVMVDGSNQVYDKEYVCSVHVSCGMPMHKPHPMFELHSNRLKENNDMSL